MNPWRFRADWLELSDLVLDIDPTTLERRPVDVGHVHDVLTAQGNPWGARILASLPTDGRGSYAPAAVDALLVRCHLELQRLALELQQGARTRDRLRGLLPWVRERVEGPIRIVDVGCGIGYVLRWLAAWGELGSDVELIGCDFNLALLEEARRLARADGLSVTFLHADAFRLGVQAHVFLSTGVLHHIPAEGLAGFFGAQVAAGALAFHHADFQASPLAPVGAWVFHQARMREPLARHDGILSAIRAHSADTLLTAARAAAPAGQVEHVGSRVVPWLPVPRAMHAVVVRT